MTVVLGGWQRRVLSGPARRSQGRKCGSVGETKRRAAVPDEEGCGRMAEEEIGRVSHYYNKIGVAAIELDKGGLKAGDTIRIKGHTTDFTQVIESMQIEHDSVTEANRGDAIGVRVSEHVREHDAVFKVTE